MELLIDFICSVIGIVIGWIVLVWNFFWETVFSVVEVFLLFFLDAILAALGLLPDDIAGGLGGAIEITGTLLTVANVYLPLAVIAGVFYFVSATLFTVWTVRLVIKLVPFIG